MQQGLKQNEWVVKTVDSILHTHEEIERHLSYDESSGIYVATYLGFIMKSAFQPIIHLDGSLMGYEALLRVYDKRSHVQCHTEQFVKSPFLSCHERLNIDTLARVLHLKNFFLHIAEGHLFLNTNPDAVIDSVSVDYFNQFIHCRIQPMGTAIDQIYLELLEYKCSSDQALTTSIQDLSKNGFKIALDDYGCKASSEIRARNVRPDIIKMDRSLLAQYMVGVQEPLLKAIRVARELNAEVLLEGVEDFNFYLKARDLDVNYLQGYFIGRPELVHYLSRPFEFFDKG